MSSPLVEAVGLAKRYPVLGHRGDRISALWDVVRGRPARRVVSVLEDIAFEVQPGESLAIIGDNGAGKSTLLKLVTGVLTPSAGSVRTRGSVGALLELGAGFHPELSGRDNVRLAAALHGLDAEALAGKLPEIEAFADIGDYLDEPVKHYSSGMVVRLGFAVIAAIRPALLITDEVLAVGDESFQRKCIRWLDDYLASGGTLLLVSHSLYHVRKLCRRALWLQDGRVRALGDAFEVSQQYLAWHEARLAATAPAPAARTASGQGVVEARLNGDDGDGPLTLDYRTDLRIDAVIRGRDDRPATLLVGIVREDDTPVFGVSSEMDGVAGRPVPGQPRDTAFGLCFPGLALLPGSYRLRLHALDGEGLTLFDTRERAFTVAGNRREFGLVQLPHRWDEVAG
ncbi:ABC transporter ATP-binding protein [Arenimonas sp. MALMAid1274]|uniref:ABC transporter ATP-binding protein n=1 Tax=Arenimonas sp. MALMAid1274 TaxID=3411630 RepID=UPI003BA0A1AA